ncbi:hypothetical protein D9615_010163 [Tricholomella constricta]|uniref:Uncharacterized protein n=1 Tax=Tricholomella constricta TaxID=117010 RepID=A0A8H5GRB2_9AGAR|nr:hypothetical protein D9615_010163 [Tricholomella constricta]
MVLIEPPSPVQPQSASNEDEDGTPLENVEAIIRFAGVVAQPSDLSASSTQQSHALTGETKDAPSSIVGSRQARRN